MLLGAPRLFTGLTPELLYDHVLVVERGRIQAVVPRAQVDADAEVVDHGDVTVLPGLVDVHQHLVFDASVDPVTQVLADDDETLMQGMCDAAQRALAAGVTTIRDLGDRAYLSLELRDRVLSGSQVGPRVVAAGPPITTVGGHCWFLGGEVDGPDGVRRAVRERVERGVDVVKIMASGGVMTPTVPPHESQLGLAEIRAAAEEAHAAGVPLAVHAHNGQAISDALEAHADTIEHCTFLSAEGVDADRSIMERLAASDCVISTTTASLPDVEVSRPAMRERIAAIRAGHEALHRAGARIVCSSDAGIAPNKPHDVLPHGVVSLLPAMGMTNAEAIENVTASAAEVCGVADRAGTLEAGKDADILVVGGNPLDDLAAIHDVVAVYARGSQAAFSSGIERRRTAISTRWSPPATGTTSKP